MNLFNVTFNTNNHAFDWKSKPMANTAVLTSNPIKINNGPDCDIFTRSDISFTSTNRSNNSTKRGKFLKRLKNITDPYSGAKILTKEEFENYQQTIPQIENPLLRINAMSKYERNMRPIEKQMYIKLGVSLRKAEKEGIHKSFKDVLNDEKPAALKRLETKEYGILNKVIEETKTMKPHNAQRVLIEVDKALKTVEDNEHHFKRKDFINNLYSMREEQKDNPHFEYLVEVANKLPNSHTDIDAFIVKYADRTEEEITERFINSSVGTIEHIIPDTFDGSNEASNFLLTTAGSNVERDVMNFKDYLKIHPKIPKYCQEYMNNVIDAIHNGEIPGYEWYPYVVAPTIEQEMGIKVDLSKYKIKPKKAFKTFPERVWDMYPQYSQYYNRKGV